MTRKRYLATIPHICASSNVGVALYSDEEDMLYVVDEEDNDRVFLKFDGSGSVVIHEYPELKLPASIKYSDYNAQGDPQCFAFNLSFGDNESISISAHYSDLKRYHTSPYITAEIQIARVLLSSDRFKHWRSDQIEKVL